MGCTRLKLTRIAAVGICVSAVLPLTLIAQQVRITGAIDNSRRIVLRGSRNPKAEPKYDQGPVDANQRIVGVTLAFKPSASQQAALEQLLREQQDPASPHYQKWLSSEEYADRFGLSPDDITAVTTWLQSEGLRVDYAARSRMWLALSGTAGQLQSAFKVEIHRYQIDGETHYANATDPAIPVALETVILLIRGLDDFRLESRRRRLTPKETYNNGGHALAPGDLATVYNIRPLYQQGITGSGQKMVVVGETSVSLSDIELFRSQYGLPKNDPQLIQAEGYPDPGTVQSELNEANLDLDWAGAIAPNASILYVYSTRAFDAAQFAIDNYDASVISMSYAACEPQISADPDVSSSSVALFWQGQAQAAVLKGITWVASSGDTGAAGCEVSGSKSATTGLAVNLPASIPEVTGVGGTEFN